MSQIKTENDENPLNLCRICGKFSKCFLDIFKFGHNGKKLVEILSFCLKQTIYQGDGLPEIICLACESNLTVAYKFHTLTVSVQKVAELKLKVESDTCRICRNFSHHTLDLFELERNGKPLVEMLSFCLNQKIHEDDGLSSIICVACESNLIMVYEFHTLYSESKRRFQEIFNKVAKVRVDIVYEPADENEIKVENEVILPVAVNDSKLKSKLKSKSKSKKKSKLKSKLKQKPYKIGKKYYRAERKSLCHVCAKECRDRNQLKYHIESAHGITLLVCYFENCNSTYKTKSSLKYHVLTHSGQRHTCNVCDKTFLRVTDVSRHMRTHSTEKSSVCTICQKAFKDNSTLAKHIKIHIGEKKHICKFCDKSFLFSTNLRLHERIHTGEKPYFCNVCSKSFRNNGGLITHRRTHTGEKPFSCKVCQMSFAQGSHLKQHERVHTGERPYVCNVCESTYSQIGHLITHQKTHTRKAQLSTHDKIRSVGLQFSCAHCGKAYTRKHTLKAHLSKCFEEHGFEDRI